MRRRDGRGRQYRITEDLRPRAPRDCGWCGGTGFVYVEEGRPVPIVRLQLEHNPDRPVKRCDHGLSDQRLPYAD